MVSLRAKLFKKALQLSGRRKKFTSEHLMEAYVQSMSQNAPYKLDHSFKQKHQISSFKSDQMDVYVLNQHSITSKTIIYFHGGAYINEPTSFHWRYLVKLAEKTNHKIYVPIYPKLPNNTHVECYQQLDYFYEKVIDKLVNNFIFMGDSAGGGLAVGFAQKLREEYKRTPEQLIVLSPWLDVDGEYEDAEELEQLDPMIAIPGAKLLGRLWAQPSHLKNPLVSPIYGSFYDIGAITVIVGTHELLLFDCRRFKELAYKQNIPLDYYEFEGMNHVFPVFPISEANEVWPIILPKLLQEHSISEPIQLNDKKVGS